MDDLYEIVDYYEELMGKDLFPEARFTDDSLHDIENNINKVNGQFFNLVERSLLSRDFGTKSLEIILNKLSTIYHDIEFVLSEHSIPVIENTVNSGSKDRFDSSHVTTTLSQILAIKGISNIYWYLKEHFEGDIKFSDELKEYSYVPPYVDEKGYKAYIKDLLSLSLEKKSLLDDFLDTLPKHIEQLEDNPTDESDHDDDLNMSIVFPSENIEQLKNGLANLTKHLANTGELSIDSENDLLFKLLVKKEIEYIRWTGRLNVLYYIFNFFTIHRIIDYSGLKYDCISKFFRDFIEEIIEPVRIKKSTSFRGEKVLDDILNEILKSCRIS